MTEAEVAAAMEVARAARLRVCAHCRSGDSVRMAVKHGIEVIYHANYCDEARARRARGRARSGLRGARARHHLQPDPGQRAVGRDPGARAGLRAGAGRLRGDHRAACASAASACCRAATTASPVHPARHLRARSLALREGPRLLADGDARGRHQAGRRDHGAARRAGRRRSRAPSPISCSWTATRSPTSRSCRTATRSA